MTQDPVLLVGGHDAAKTLLINRLARALNKKFYAYDASKAMFEDVIGFPNPHSLSNGIIEYTPLFVTQRRKGRKVADNFTEDYSCAKKKS